MPILIARVFFGLSIVSYCWQYGRVLWIPPSYDDWGMIEIVRASYLGVGWSEGLWNLLTEPLAIFWRPLHVLPFVLVQGESLFFVQLVKLAIIILMSFLFVHCARALDFTQTASLVIGSVLLLHQSQVLGGEPDIMGDVMCSLAVILALLVSAKYEQSQESVRNYAMKIGLITALACLGKEAGVMIVFIPLVFALVREQSQPSELKRAHLRASMASVLVVFSYLIIRNILLQLPSMDTVAGSDWGFKFGINIFQNIGLLAGALCCPVSTIEVFMGNVAARIIAAIWILAIAAVVTIGLWRSWRLRDYRLPVIFAILFVVVQGPTLLFDHVNERNFTRSLPLGILLVAFALRQIWPVATRAVRILLSVFFVLWIAFSQQAVAAKVTGIINMHSRADRFLDAVVSAMPTPPNRMIIFAAEYAPPGYSEYIQPFWQHMPGTSDLGLAYRYNNPNFKSDFYIVKSLTAIPDTLPKPDFGVMADGSVLDLR